MNAKLQLALDDVSLENALDLLDQVQERHSLLLKKLQFLTVEFMASTYALVPLSLYPKLKLQPSSKKF